ncbi:laccase, multicopper oxidase, benzenediol:oxygen oxidorectuctase [Paramarasmius palmivorus]|uniref:laccase n=1 Tax=Paramarasmius palmivorus TaxID=297713 RepID=A0AAW0BUF1_9AGAR
MARIHSLLSLITVSVLLGASRAAIGPVADLVITNQVVSPDGFSREAILAGGSTIGPLIVATKGDTLKLNVVNNLHVPDQSMLQSTSISTVITLADWYHAKAKGTVIGNPQTTLINGLGRWSQGSATDLTVIKVTQGKRYRMRLVNVACDPAYEFSIDSHLMNIIEADGVNHEQHEVDQLKIYAGKDLTPGEHFNMCTKETSEQDNDILSLLVPCAIIFSETILTRLVKLNANQPVGNYWIRANPNLGVQGFTNGINSAILRYEGAAEEEPLVVTFSPSKPLREADLAALENPGAPGNPTPGGVDYALNLAFTFTGGRFQVNGVSYGDPPVPVLLQILSGAQTPDSLLPQGSVFHLPANAVVELSMPGGLLGLEHPIHLHGHSFDVVRSAGSSTYNYANPPRRDVVNIGSASDNVTIRFRTDNPGPWFLHCHIDWHLDTGFAAVFAERPEEWTSTINPPVAWENLCPTYQNTPASDL